MRQTFSASPSARCATSSTNMPTSASRSRRRTPQANIRACRWWGSWSRINRCKSSRLRGRSRVGEAKARPLSFLRVGVVPAASECYSLQTSRIIRRVRVAEYVDGVAGLQGAALEGGVDIEREIEDRERADCVESPGRDALHGLRREVHEAVLGRSAAKGQSRIFAHTRLPRGGMVIP